MRLLAVGSDAESTVTDAFGKGASFYPNAKYIDRGSMSNEITGKEALLVKGSRAQHMERVTDALLEEGRV